MTIKHESSALTYSDGDSLKARQEIFERLATYPSTPEEKERSLGLFLRGSLLARILAISEIYQQICPLPGCILDIGTWRGQTAVLCENLRAIFEPLNFNRNILCFDTFDGYHGFGEKDQPSAHHHEGSYALSGDSYAEYLSELLCIHERSNAMGHNHGKHKVIVGDCRESIPAYFTDFPNTTVALAFFDVNAYLPTAEALAAIWPRLVPSGIVAMWQLTRDSVPAEGRVYVEHVLGQYPHRLLRSQTYPGLCYLIKQ